MKKIIVLTIDGYSLTAVADDGRLLLVDCGYPGFGDQIEQKLQEQNCSLRNLSQIIITHHDPDHVGAARELADRVPSVEIMSSAEQAPYITGEKKSLRLAELERICPTLPEEQRAVNLKSQEVILSIKPVSRVTALTPGQVLPIYGGAEIVDTAGHHPGHISVYIGEEKTLIAGDALVRAEGGLRANPAYTFDMPTAVKSAKHLLDYDIRKIICFHGGVYEGDIRQALLDMIRAQG